MITFPKRKRVSKIEPERIREVAHNVGSLLTQSLKEAGLNPSIKLYSSPYTDDIAVEVRLLDPSGQQIEDTGASIRVGRRGVQVAFSTWDILGKVNRTAMLINYRRCGR